MGGKGSGGHGINAGRRRKDGTKAQPKAKPLAAPASRLTAYFNAPCSAAAAPSKPRPESRKRKAERDEADERARKEAAMRDQASKDRAARDAARVEKRMTQVERDHRFVKSSEQLMADPAFRMQILRRTINCHHTGQYPMSDSMYKVTVEDLERLEARQRDKSDDPAAGLA